MGGVVVVSLKHWYFMLVIVQQRNLHWLFDVEVDAELVTWLRSSAPLDDVFEAYTDDESPGGDEIERGLVDLCPLFE